MTISLYMYLVLSCTTSILSLTIGSGPSLIQQTPSNTTLLPLSLLNLTPHDELPNMSLTTMPPIRWNYEEDGNFISIYRGPQPSKDWRSKPGVSMYNWRSAVGHASLELEDECKKAGLKMADRIPDGHFNFVTLLAKPAAVHFNRPRKLIFDMRAEESEPGLSYAAADMVLTAYIGYGEQWKTGDRGSAKDQVRMSRFELRDETTTLIAQGTVSLLVPPENNGAPTVEGLLVPSSLPEYS